MSYRFFSSLFPDIPEEKRKQFADFKIKQEIKQDGDTVHVKAFMPMFEQVLEMKTDNTEQEFDDMLTGQRAKVYRALSTFWVSPSGADPGGKGSSFGDPPKLQKEGK